MIAKVDSIKHEAYCSPGNLNLFKKYKLQYLQVAGLTYKTQEFGLTTFIQFGIYLNI